MPQVSASNVLSSLASLFKGKTVLHMGCKDCGNEEAYLGVKVLNKLGMSIDVKEFQCGCELYGADDAKIRALSAENKKLLKGYSTVIVGCARCLQVFREYYGINARHITQVIAERLEGMDRKFIGTGDVLYHDPCFMARYSKIMEEPRAVLAKLGYNVVEFKNCREKSDCCGDYSPIQAMRERGAVLRLAQVRAPGTVTAACPKCTLNFSCFNRANSKITVKPFLELVDYALNMDIPSVF